MNISEKIKYVGVLDLITDLFDGQYLIPDGISYNSYVILDESCAVIDSVDARFSEEWLENVRQALAGRTPDYLVVQHMEPDHSGSIENFLNEYPTARLVASDKAFGMIKSFFGKDYRGVGIAVKDGDTLPLGTHTLRFIGAPMVHWPEVILSFEESEGVLFSADAFGRFGKPDAKAEWDTEARRYYIGIVGKYGVPVQTLLKKVAALDIKTIAPLHGPGLKEDLSRYISLYDTWSGYRPEREGAVIAYASIYGNTRAAAEELEGELKKRGVETVIYDLARCDKSKAIADAFRYDTLVLASATYNAGVFPPMREFISGLTERAYSSRRVALIENGSWAPSAAKVMRSMLEGQKDITFFDTSVKITSALSEESRASIIDLANEICK